MATSKNVMSKMVKRNTLKNFATNRKIVELIFDLDMSINKFSQTLGYERPDNIYNVVNEKVEASTKIVNRILSVYPEFTHILYRGTGLLVSDNSPEYKRKKTTCQDCKHKDRVIRAQHKTIHTLEAELAKLRK